MDKIILAPKQMHKNLLLTSRREDIFVNLKILTKEEFLNKYYGLVTKEGFYELFKKHDLIYDNLAEIAPYISRSTSLNVRNKNKFLFQLKNELESKNLLERDEFFEQFIKDKEFEIYGYCNEDSELLFLLSKYNIKFEFKEFTKGNNQLTVNKFPILEDEIFYMLNSVAEMLENGVFPKDIFIYTSNENAIYYISKYSESFGFKVNLDNSQSLYSQEIVSTFLKIAKDAHSFEKAIESLPENSEIANSLRELNSLELDFDKKFDYISSYIKTRKLQKVRYENAVNVIDSPIYEENKTIFIPCFAQNIYPKSYKDTGYISDEDKTELNVLTSLDKCRIENEISKAFLLSNNRFILSRSSASFSEKYFESPFVKSLKITENEIRDLPNKIYSKKYGEYRLGIDLDKKRYFLQHSKCEKSLNSQLEINYRKYDNSYSNADAFEQNKLLKLSYSSAKTFFECPFAYYLNNVLKLKVIEDRFESRIGNLAHAIFEKQFENDFDFDKCFEDEKKNFDWKPGEILLLEHLKNDIKKASDACILHFKSYAKNPDYKNEESFETIIAPNTKLIGRADKILVLDDSDLIVVDYKTNNESFERKKIPYGLSMQLPTYAYLLSQDKKYSDLHIAGLYIHNIINKNYSVDKDEEDIIDSNLKLNGLTVANQESAMKIDSSLMNEKSFFVKGLALKKGEFVKKGSSLIGEEELKDMEQLVLDKYMEANERIRNNDFPISPLFLSTDGPCKYCKHRDICFLRGYQKRAKDDDGDEGGDE